MPPASGNGRVPQKFEAALTHKAPAENLTGDSGIGQAAAPADAPRQGTQEAAQPFAADLSSGIAAPAPAPAQHALASAPAQEAHAPVPALPSDPAANPIHAARLLQGAGSSEMRLGLHSAEFGPISIATSASSGSLQASITLDHGALGHAIAAHLPAIEEKFGMAARVEVRDGGTSFNHPNQGGSSQFAQGGRPSRAYVPALSSPAIESIPAATQAPVLSTARLSVLA